MDPKLEQLVKQASQAGPGQTRAAAKLMTFLGDHPQRLPELFEGMTHWPQARLVLGITGPPGAGKSTLTDHLIAEFRQRQPDRRIGVVAVDPSSPFTGGAVLGDRVRMMRHATDPNVFIRSLASRGHLGGLTLGAKGILRIMGLIGCDVVLLETVGVGQSEVEVAGTADLVMVVLAPGQGDGVQMLKAGLMEVGDIFTINKADRQGAQMLFQQLISVLMMDTPPADATRDDPCSVSSKPSNGHGAGHGLVKTLATPTGCGDKDNSRLEAGDVVRHIGQADVALTAANDHQGVPELVDLLEQRIAEGAEQWQRRRQANLQEEIRESVLQEARRRVAFAFGRNGAGDDQVRRILRGDQSVEALAQALLEKVAREGPSGSPP